MDSSLAASLRNPAAGFIRPVLGNEEELLWVDRPPSKTTSRVMYIMIVVYAVIVVYTLLSHPGGMLNQLLFGPGVGFWMRILRFGVLLLPVLIMNFIFKDPVTRNNHAIYAVTNERVILMNDMKSRYQALRYGNMKGAKLLETTPTPGSITFTSTLKGKVLMPANYTPRSKSMMDYDPPFLKYGFLRIAHAQEVYDLIQSQWLRFPENKE